LLLENRYELNKLKTSSKEEEEEESAKQQQHYIEDATCHYILKKILEKDSERQKDSCLSNYRKKTIKN
jgi:hypothetical protein